MGEEEKQEQQAPAPQADARPTVEIERTLRSRYPAVESFLRDSEASFLIVRKDAV